MQIQRTLEDMLLQVVEVNGVFEIFCYSHYFTMTHKQKYARLLFTVCTLFSNIYDWLLLTLGSNYYSRWQKEACRLKKGSCCETREGGASKKECLGPIKLQFVSFRHKWWIASLGPSWIRYCRFSTNESRLSCSCSQGPRYWQFSFIYK